MDRQLTEFNLQQMVANAHILIVAKRGSGKSYVVRDIMYHLRNNISTGTVIAPTDRLNAFYKYFFPDLFIHYKIDDSLVKKILHRQSFVIKKPDAASLLVLDDCMFPNKSICDDNFFMEIIHNARCYLISYILAVQVASDQILNIGKTFDYIFLLRDDSISSKKNLWNKFASVIPTFKQFDEIFTNYTKDYGAIVIDNTIVSDNITDKIFWFKSKERAFQFGSNTFQMYHNKYYAKSNQIIDPNPCFDAINIDTDYLAYFVNEAKFNKSMINDNNNYGARSDDAVNKLTLSNNNDNNNINHNADDDALHLAYADDTYKLSVAMSNLNNLELIKILCEHINKLKHIQ